jgi:hypothetical protein
MRNASTESGRCREGIVEMDRIVIPGHFRKRQDILVRNGSG